MAAWLCSFFGRPFLGNPKAAKQSKKAKGSYLSVDLSFANSACKVIARRGSKLALEISYCPSDFMVSCQRKARTRPSQT